MYTMERRLELHEALCEVLGSRNVYFQPPDNVTMRYPCFVFIFYHTKWEIFNFYSNSFIYFNFFSIFTEINYTNLIVLLECFNFFYSFQNSCRWT